MITGLVSAFAAAVAYGAATIMQAVGVRRLAGAEPGWRSRARAGWPYAAGLLLDLVGFAVSVIALRTLPLFLVESAIASSVAVTALLSVLVLKARLSPREVAAVAVVLLGLVLLAATAVEGPAAVQPGWTGWVLLAGSVPVTALLAAWWLPRSASVAPLSVAAGLGFAGVGIAARLLPVHGWGTIAEPGLYALGVFGIGGTIGYALALERGQVTAVAAVTFAVETVVPAGIGLFLLGDRIRPGLVSLAVLGFVLTLGACVSLASRSEVPSEPAAG